MPAFAAQYQFAAAFTVFLVALAGIALVALGARPLTKETGARLALGFGFLGIGTAAFLSGSLLVEDRGDPSLLALRAAGVAGLLAGSLRWRASALSRWLLWAGCAGLLARLVPQASDASAAAAALSVVGGLLVGAALISASRRAIAARVAASAAATLLLVVLLLSVALSTVLADTVADQTLRDLDSRAVIEAGAIEAHTRAVGRDAAAVGELLANAPAVEGDVSTPLLAQLAAEGSAPASVRAAVERELEQARAGGYPTTGFVYLSEAREVVAAVGLDRATVQAAAGSPAVTLSLTSPERRGLATIELLDDRAIAVGVRPMTLAAGGPGAPLGAVLAVGPIDGAFLTERTGDLTDDSITIVGPRGPVAQSGPAPDDGVVQRLSSALLQERRPTSSAVTEARFVSAQPVRVNGVPVLAVLASRSTESVEEGRRRLFQTFFVIAFGGTVLALVLAALVGDRIGAGIRRLTSSAEAIQQGELGVRSGVRSEDEVGVLGATFDSMAASIEEQTDALQEAATRVEAIVAGMGEALVAVDALGCITDFNTAAQELLGVGAADAHGRAVADVLRVTREDGADLTPRLQALEPARWSELAELAVEGADAVPVALTAGALRGPDGEVTGGVIVLRDLRGEREVERMKRHFLSRVGHELRTPLTPLIGYSQMLSGRDLPPERAKAVYRSILSAAKRLERIVEMLEFFASLDAGRQVLHPEPIDVRRILADVVERRAPSLVGTSHTLAKRVARDTPDVFADGRWLARSIDELVDNALKFSPNGGRVVVSAGRFDGDPTLVEVAVRDSGVGMSPSQVDSAFTEWAQGDESDTRSFGGLGLGLALVQRVAEHHGGRVACQTAPGKGSRLSIVLPAAPVQEPAPMAGGGRRSRGRRSPSDGDATP